MIVAANMAAPTLFDYLHFLIFFTYVFTFSTGETGTVRFYKQAAPIITFARFSLC